MTKARLRGLSYRRGLERFSRLLFFRLRYFLFLRADLRFLPAFLVDFFEAFFLVAIAFPPGLALT
jgi:hypothetical protein